MMHSLASFGHIIIIFVLMRLCVGFISTVVTNHGQHVIITKCLDLGFNSKPLGNFPDIF